MTMVRPAGFEPATFWFEARHSNPLSYGRVSDVYYRIRDKQEAIVVMQYNIKTIEHAEAALLPYVPLVAELTGKDTTLHRIRPLMALLGNPQNSIKAIHIAGTSGKTSVAYYTAALLRASGKRVGLTVSPHVDSVTERIQINGEPLSEERFCSELAEFLQIVSTAQKKPSYFELLYAFAIWEFVRSSVEYAVVETGMGGLYDATNMIDREDKICVITDIGFDHMHVLGNTLPEITAQKIGIVHEHNPVMMYEQAPDIMDVVTKWTTLHHAPLHATTEKKEREIYDGNLAHMPAYQQRNWLLAYRVYIFTKRRDDLPALSKELLLKTQAIQVPGRMDAMTIQGKTLVMDGAHNGQKMSTFIATFEQRYPNQKPAVLISLKQGKEYTEVAPLIASFASSVIVTAFRTSQDLPAQSIAPAELAEAIRFAGNEHITVVADYQKALRVLLRKDEKLLVITGSFYLLSQIRKEL
jgi:dihydrofolate synthase/folylpolyglutamate synthase